MARRDLLASIRPVVGALKLRVLNVLISCLPREESSSKKTTSIEESSSSETILESAQNIAQRIAHDFDFSDTEIQRAVTAFIHQLGDGLKHESSTIEQLPSYITQIPSGLEKGTYLAVDLGGTNLRVCSVTLNGDGTHSLVQHKKAIPVNLMTSATPKPLFGFVAQQIEAFVRETCSNVVSSDTLSLGFTFSHAVTQKSINSGILIRWSKGFNIEGVVGRDICALLQIELDELYLPIRVTALLNDTVGTLMARGYASPSSANTIVGAVFGTGTNGAYIEKASKITKLAAHEGSDELMIVNTEWGNFDQKLEVLPNTTYDVEVDNASVNPGFEMFEKRISGMYLGEILRRVILGLMKDSRVSLFNNATASDLSTISTPWAVESEFMSLIAVDTTPNLSTTRLHIKKHLKIANPTYEEANLIKTISFAIGRRSARLSAVALGAVVLQTESLEETGDVDIGVDGSLIELYPGYVDEVMEGLKCVKGIGNEGARRITIVVAKDGSGVGAALTAHVATMAQGVR